MRGSIENTLGVYPFVVSGSPTARPTCRCACANRVMESIISITSAPCARKYSAHALATSIARMKKIGVPVVMDCTHSVQKPNQTEGITGGNPEMIEAIALSAVATGADGLFLEVHPEPHKAQSDPHTMLRLDRLAPILEKCLKIRKALAQ